MAIHTPSSVALDANAVLDLGVAGCLELFKCLSAHGGVYMQIRHADHSRQLFEYEENRAIVNEFAPVQSSHQISLLRRQFVRDHQRIGVAPERLAMFRNDQVVQEPVEPV